LEPKPFELAFSLACFPAAKREAIALNGAAGVRWCEVVPGIEGLERAVAFGQALKGTSMHVWSLHAPFGGAANIASADEQVRSGALSITRRACDVAAALGAHVVVVHPGAEPVAEAERAATLARSRDGLAELSRYCAALKLRMAVEFLPRTCPGNTAAELAYLLADLDPGVAGVCLDLNHANLGQDLNENVRILGGRIITLHVSDNDGVDERHWLPGQGVVDYRGAIEALYDCGYHGPFLYESSTDRSGAEVTPEAIRENYEQVIAPLLR